MGSSINNINFFKGTKEGDGGQKFREELTLHNSKKVMKLGRNGPKGQEKLR